jgi:hypothetical protein
MIEKYIEQLKKELEIEESLATQVPGIYALPIEEGVTITIGETPQCITYFCPLGPAPQKKEEEVFAKLMLGNLFGQGTRGATLGLNNDANLVILSQEINYNADYKEFKEVLEDFINSVDYWRSELINYA